MRLHATGQLQHHFWGDYQATVVLEFDSDLAHLAIDKLSPAGLGAQWKVNPANPMVLGIFVDNEQLTRLEEHLAGLGADIEKIGSIEHSIDYGDPFEITVDVEDPKQLGLFAPRGAEALH